MPGLFTGETYITHKMWLSELEDAEAAASKMTRFAEINAAADLSPCVIGLLRWDGDDDMEADVEVRALLFVECYKENFQGVDAVFVKLLKGELDEGKTLFSMLSYPETYWMSAQE